MIRPEHFWTDKQIELLLGAEVVCINAEKQQLELCDGRRIGYGDLIWSGGGTPRKLPCPGAALAGVHSVRDKGDVDRLMAQLDAGAKRAVVVGGGYIGLETAAALVKMGCEVALLEMTDRVLARVAGEALSRFFEGEHRAHGVDLHLNAKIHCLEGDGTKVTGVRMADGVFLPCDMVIVGIGIEPSIGPLADAGVKVSNGIEVDAFCRTNLPHVYAIGDCAAHANAFAAGALVRLESVQNANDMATTAAKAICGKEEPYEATPWFWFNQYDLKLQTVGLCQGHDTTVVRGDSALRSFSVIYLKEGRIIALDCINAMKDYVQGRKLVELGSILEPRWLARSEIPLKALLDPAEMSMHT